MSTIRIKRTDEYINRMRTYMILIDGQQVGTIANGETKDFTTTAGQHTVTAKIDWCSSPVVLMDMNDHQIESFKVGGFKNSQLLMPIGLGLIVLHFILSQFADFEYTILLVAPFLLSLAYYLTIGSKKYLTLEKTNVI